MPFDCSKAQIYLAASKSCPGNLFTILGRFGSGQHFNVLLYQRLDCIRDTVIFLLEVGGRRRGGEEGEERQGEGSTFRNTGSYSVCKIYLHVFIHLFPEDSNAVIILLNISNLLLNLQHSNNATVSTIAQLSTTFGSLAGWHTTRQD